MKLRKMDICSALRFWIHAGKVNHKNWCQSRIKYWLASSPSGPEAAGDHSKWRWMVNLRLLEGCIQHQQTSDGTSRLCNQICANLLFSHYEMPFILRSLLACCNVNQNMTRVVSALFRIHSMSRVYAMKCCKFILCLLTNLDSSNQWRNKYHLCSQICAYL